MLEQLQADPLFSIRRAVFNYSLAFIVSLSDMWLIHILGINTPEELLTQTLILGTGLYLGHTLAGFLIVLLDFEAGQLAVRGNAESGVTYRESISHDIHAELRRDYLFRPDGEIEKTNKRTTSGT